MKSLPGFVPAILIKLFYHFVQLCVSFTLPPPCQENPAPRQNKDNSLQIDPEPNNHPKASKRIQANHEDKP